MNWSAEQYLRDVALLSAAHSEFVLLFIRLFYIVLRASLVPTSIDPFYADVYMHNS